MGETGPENEVEFKNRLGRELLDELLVKQEIDPEEFYGLAMALQGVPYLKGVKAGMCPADETVVILMADYTGEMPLGSARVRDPEIQRWVVKPEVQAGVEGIYADITKRTGFEFHEPDAHEDENHCHAYALVKDPKALKTLGHTTMLEVMLIKNDGNL